MLSNFFIETQKGLQIVDINFHGPYRNFEDFKLYVDIVMKINYIKPKFDMTDDHYKALRQCCIRHSTIDKRCVNGYIVSLNREYGYIKENMDKV